MGISLRRIGSKLTPPLGFKPNVGCVWMVGFLSFFPLFFAFRVVIAGHGQCLLYRRVNGLFYFNKIFNPEFNHLAVDTFVCSSYFRVHGDDFSIG